jgi:hypothetical protein
MLRAPATSYLFQILEIICHRVEDEVGGEDYYSRDGAKMESVMREA